MKHKKSVIMLLAMAAALMFSSCAANPAPVTTFTTPVEITLSWWGNDARHEYMLEAVDRFEDMHPEISVKCRYTEWSGYQTRSDVLMRSGTESDVMLINYAWIEQYSPDGNGYYDLNQLSDIIDLTNFSEYELSYGMKKGKLNAIPIAMNTQTVYINKTLYQQYGLDIPKTWDDLFEAAKAMKGDVYPIAMAAKPMFFFVTAYAEQVCGKKFMEQDGTVNFTAEDFEVMLEFYCRLINENVMPQVEYFDRNDINTGKYAGTLAWLSDGSSYFGKAAQNGYEYVVADYPVNDTAKCGDGWYAKPATMYAMSRNTSHPKEAAMLLDYLLNSEEIAQLQGVEKGIPLSKAGRQYLSDNVMLSGIQYEAYEKMNEFDELSVLSPYFENDDLIEEFRYCCNTVLYEKNTVGSQAEYLYSVFSKIKE